MAEEVQFTPGQYVGIALIVVTAGIAGLEQAGFGFGLQLGLQTFLAIAGAGGLLGGLLLVPQHRLAGALGGLVGGPGGLLVTHFWVAERSSVWNVELVLTLGVGGLPGILLGVMIYKLFPGTPAQDPRDAEV